ncbi:S1 RNA-binding domain-containing protein [Streptomyces sp. NPDC004288]
MGQDAREFLAGIRIGDIYSGTVAEVTRRQGVTVTLDGFPARPLGTVRPLDVSWSWNQAVAVKVGQRITAEVIAVDLDEGHARLAMTATESPELWTFLKSRRRGEILSGTIAAIERFGVFVALDDGPDHPGFPGVGFITVPELSWQHVEALSDVVQVGQRVSSHGTGKPGCP